MYKNAIIFGGCGYIGRYFTRELLSSKAVEKVYLADFVNYEPEALQKFFTAEELQNIESMHCDVRKPVDLDIGEIDLIGNFAAVHREPGHEVWEYFETNLRGAENIIAWAEQHNAKHLLFTSTIATYGPTEDLKKETSLQVPVTAYGSSKLVAEKIQAGWYLQDKENRYLTIVRPGVVYGPGETGNVTRMVKAVNKGYFFYMGNRQTVKASIYIKELCSSMAWVMAKQIEAGDHLVAFNSTLDPGPTIENFVEGIRKAGHIKRKVLSLPYKMLLFASGVIDFFAKMVGLDQPVNPVRIRKLKKSNNISAEYLKNNGYQYRYGFDESLADWKSSDSEDWS